MSLKLSSARAETVTEKKKYDQLPASYKKLCRVGGESFKPKIKV